MKIKERLKHFWIAISHFSDFLKNLFKAIEGYEYLLWRLFYVYDDKNSELFNTYSEEIFQLVIEIIKALWK